jgi:hypothetical protein
MTIWSCTVFQFNPKCQPLAETILSTPNKKYIYDVWKRPSNTAEGESIDEPLKLYIDSVSTTSSRTRIDLQLDRESPSYYVRDGEPQRYRITVRLGIDIHKIPGWPAMVCVYGRYDNANKFRGAFKRVYADQTGKGEMPLYSIGFKLTENTDSLLQVFPNMRKIRVEGIQGSQIDTAILSGFMLEESPEFQKWVKSEDYSGRVSYFGVTVGDETVVLSTFGNMYSRQGKELRPTNTVLRVLRGLISTNALVYTPTIDSY